MLFSSFGKSDTRQQGGDIFISIAAFCDAELEHTIKDLLAQADKPQNLTLGICIQDTPENLAHFPYNKHKQCRVIKVPHTESKGCCWARSEIQKLYSNETYYMQIDSHHRFVKGWDTLCKKWLRETGSAKPILSSYLITYDIDTAHTSDYLNDEVPYRLQGDIFYDNQKLRIAPHTIDDYIFYDKPLYGYLMSAHFIFTYGNWIKEVPYDPYLYFEGEEDTLSVRSYTHGWDIFHPHRAVGYHYYTRAAATKHHDVVSNWYETDKRSLDRMRKILGITDNQEIVGPYGLGSVRSLDDYTRKSGIDYANQSIRGSERNILYQQRLWLYDGGYFKRYETGRWAEYKDALQTATFSEVEHTPHSLILYDTQRSLCIKLTHNHGFFKQYDEDGFLDEWVLFTEGFWKGSKPEPVDPSESVQIFRERCEAINPGKPVGICSLRTPNIADWARLAEYNQKAYAARYDHSYYLYHDLVVIEDIPHWNKIRILMHHLPKHEYVMWVDSDAIFTNFTISITDIIGMAPGKDLLVCNDIGGWTLNTGVMILKNTPWMNKTLQMLWEMEHIPHSKAAEQSQLIALLNATDPSFEHWHIFDQKTFNCHPDRHSDGDYVLHMMGLSGEERTKTFNYWNQRLGVYK